MAGRGAGPKSIPQLRQYLASYQIDFELVATSQPGEAFYLSHQATLDGFDVVVAVGGDVAAS